MNRLGVILRHVNTYHHFLKTCILILRVGVFCLHAYMCAMRISGVFRGQKRLSDFLELELQMAMGDRWVLGTELVSFARAINALNHGALSSGPSFI